MKFEAGKSGNPTGRRKGHFSAEGEILRAKENAMRNVARKSEEGDLRASIAVLDYCHRKGDY